MTTRSTLTAFSFASPWLLGFAALIVYPFTASLYWSFCRYDLLSPPEFVGTQHYERLATELASTKAVLSTPTVVPESPIESPAWRM